MLNFRIKTLPCILEKYQILQQLFTYIIVCNILINKIILNIFIVFLNIFAVIGVFQTISLQCCYKNSIIYPFTLTRDKLKTSG